MALDDRVYISESDKAIYDRLKKYVDGPLKGRKNKELFMMAMILGYYKTGVRSDLKKPKDYDHVENLGPERRTIIKAIAVAEEGMEVLNDEAQIYSIANEYAATGIKILEGMANDPDFDFIKKLENILVEEYDSKKMGE
jgi:hypothetical protein